MVEEHQREQSARLRFVGGEGELAGESDRLARQVHPARVAGRVDEVEHAQHHREVAGLVQAAPAQTWVRYGGPDAAPVTTDGPLPETNDLVAGWYMVDVESYERAVELAAYISSEPGPGGGPLYEWIDVREVMSEAPSDD